MILDALERVFECCSPTLHTLVIHDPRLMKSLTIKFPLLTDLCIQQFRSEPRASDPHTYFPAVRRLHIANCEDLRHDELWRDLAAYTPGLTHIRLSRLMGDDQFLRMLRALLQVPPRSRSKDKRGPSSANSPTAEAPLDIPEGLPHLQYACIDLSCYAAVEFEEGLLKLAEDIREGPANGAQLDLILDSYDTRYYSQSAAERHWLDLLNGGNGPWCLPSK